MTEPKPVRSVSNPENQKIQSIEDFCKESIQYAESIPKSPPNSIPIIPKEEVIPLKEKLDRLTNNIDYDSPLGFKLFLEQYETTNIRSSSDYKSVKIRTLNSYIILHLIKQLKRGHGARTTEAAFIKFGYNRSYSIFKQLDIYTSIDLITDIKQVFQYQQIKTVLIPCLNLNDIIPIRTQQHPTTTIILHIDQDDHGEFVELSQKLGITLGDLNLIYTIFSLNAIYDNSPYNDDYAIFTHDNGYIKRIKDNITNLSTELLTTIKSLYELEKKDLKRLDFEIQERLSTHIADPQSLHNRYIELIKETEKYLISHKVNIDPNQTTLPLF